MHGVVLEKGAEKGKNGAKEKGKSGAKDAGTEKGKGGLSKEMDETPSCSVKVSFAKLYAGKCKCYFYGLR